MEKASMLALVLFFLACAWRMLCLQGQSLKFCIKVEKLSRNFTCRSDSLPALTTFAMSPSSCFYDISNMMMRCGNLELLVRSTLSPLEYFSEYIIRNKLHKRNPRENLELRSGTMVVINLVSKPLLFWVFVSVFWRHMDDIANLAWKTTKCFKSSITSSSRHEEKKYRVTWEL